MLKIISRIFFFLLSNPEKTVSHSLGLFAMSIQMLMYHFQKQKKQKHLIKMKLDVSSALYSFPSPQKSNN